MRAVLWIIIAFLFAGAAILTFWPFGAAQPYDASPPGQYPLASSQFQWPRVERAKAYRPAASMGTEAFTASDATAPKVHCATSTVCPE
jgi:hypothetical protein